LCLPTVQRFRRNVGTHPASHLNPLPVNAASRSVRLSACSPQTRRNGLAVVVDATRSAWRMTRACIRQVGVVLGADAAVIIVLRPEAFWDKQRVDNCARTQKEGEVRCRGGGGSRGCQTEGDMAYGEWWYRPTYSYPGHAMEASGTKEHSTALWIGGRVGPRAGLDGSWSRYNVLLLTGIELRFLGRPDHCLVTMQTEPYRPTILRISFCN